MQAVAEEIIGGKGSVDLNAGLLNSLEGRGDDILFLSAWLGIEGQHGDAGIIDAEVALQRGVQQAAFLHELVGGDISSHIFER